jgi:hypothetical protein
MVHELFNVFLNHYNDYENNRPYQSIDETSQIIINVL